MERDNFDMNGLYILLDYQDSATAWHWRLYTSDAPDGDEGFAIHVQNRDDRGVYIIERHDPYDGVSSLTTLLMLKIGQLDDAASRSAVKMMLCKKLGDHVDVGMFMRDVSRVRRERDGKVFTCRVYVMDLVERLAAAGFIQCSLAAELEDEVKALGAAASKGFRVGRPTRFYESAYSH